MKRGIRLTGSGLLLALAVLFATKLAVTKAAALPDERAVNEKTLRDLDADWAKAASALNLDRTVSFYADDASVFVPNAPIATGHEAIRAAWSKLLVGYAGSWQATKVEASSGGDLGYIMGTYAGTFAGPDGKPAADRGKYVEVWKKQANGKWKCVADIYNSDLPLPTATQ
ncbi:MAG: YybH family protein [Candidatus Acidiferrales bacterium]